MHSSIDFIYDRTLLICQDFISSFLQSFDDQSILLRRQSINLMKPLTDQSKANLCTTTLFTFSIAGNMNLSVKWQHMMFTHGIKGNILFQNHFTADSNFALCLLTMIDTVTAIACIMLDNFITSFFKIFKTNAEAVCRI